MKDIEQARRDALAQMERTGQARREARTAREAPAPVTPPPRRYSQAWDADGWGMVVDATTGTTRHGKVEPATGEPVYGFFERPATAAAGR